MPLVESEMWNIDQSRRLIGVSRLMLAVGQSRY